MPPLAPSTFSLGELSPNAQWRMAAHWHGQFHELIIVLAGAMRLRTPAQELEAHSGDVLFYPAGLVHEESSLPENPVHTLFLSFRQVDYGVGIPLRQLDRDGRVRQMALWLQRDLAAGRAATECRPLYAALLAEVFRLGSGPVDPWVQTVRARFQRELASDHSLANTARRAGMSRFAFLRKFKRLTGNTPMAELRLLRLNAARQRLLSSGDPLKMIAPAVGLGDEFQLSKLFRRHFGFSPSQFRTASSAGEKPGA